jgi:hypothetical protein
MDANKSVVERPLRPFVVYQNLPAGFELKHAYEANVSINSFKRLFEFARVVTRERKDPGLEGDVPRHARGTTNR